MKVIWPLLNAKLCEITKKCRLCLRCCCPSIKNKQTTLHRCLSFLIVGIGPSCVPLHNGSSRYLRTFLFRFQVNRHPDLSVLFSCSTFQNFKTRTNTSRGRCASATRTMYTLTWGVLTQISTVRRVLATVGILPNGFFVIETAEFSPSYPQH